MNVSTLCLGSLCLTDATGYDIKKLFEAAFRHFHNASYGSIYPSLNRLLAQGLISLRVEPGERHPDRKVYSITDAGRRAFVDELTTTVPTEQLRSEFLVLMFFAHLLPTERLAALLDEVAAGYRETLDYLLEIRDQPGHTAGIRFTIDMGIASLRAKLETLDGRRQELLRSHRAVPAQSHEPPRGSDWGRA